MSTEAATEHTWAVGDIVRTRTGRTDRIVVRVDQPCPPDEFAARMARYEAGRGIKPVTFTRIYHHAIRDGRPFGASRVNRSTDLTLIRPAT